MSHLRLVARAAPEISIDDACLGLPDGSQVDDTGPGPDEELHAKQARAMVLAALDRIPLPRRAVLVMHELDDVPVAEVASVLSLPPFTVYSRLRKARRELQLGMRRLLKDSGAE